MTFCARHPSLPARSPSTCVRCRAAEAVSRGYQTETGTHRSSCWLLMCRCTVAARRDSAWRTAPPRRARPARRRRADGRSPREVFWVARVRTFCGVWYGSLAQPTSRPYPPPADRPSLPETGDGRSGPYPPTLWAASLPYHTPQKVGTLRGTMSWWNRRTAPVIQLVGLAGLAALASRDVDRTMTCE